MSAPRSRADLALGVAGGAMVLGAVALLFVGGPEDGVGEPVMEAPALEMVRPRHREYVRTDDLVVVFRSEEELGVGPGGWGTDSLHLHLSLDGTEIMPAAADIERMQEGLYRWTLARPDTGNHTLRLSWSDIAHRPIAAGASRSVVIRIEP